MTWPDSVALCVIMVSAVAIVWAVAWAVLSELTQDMFIRIMCRFAEKEIGRDRIRLVGAEPYYARAE